MGPGIWGPTQALVHPITLDLGAAEVVLEDICPDNLNFDSPRFLEFWRVNPNTLNLLN